MTSHGDHSSGCLAGVGLREPHFREVVAGQARPLWLEWLIDNYMNRSQQVYDDLGAIREQHQVAFHGVGLNVGSRDDLDWAYVDRLKELADWFEPFLVSDHLAFVQWNGRHHHDLMPVLFSDDFLSHCVNRVDAIQNRLGRPILLENPTQYIRYRGGQWHEADFLRALARRSGCGLLLDLNNLWVNSQNHGFDPLTYLTKLEGAPIGQVHLAGHLETPTGLVDTHGGAVADPVWQLFQTMVARFGGVPTLMEWDQNIPAFEVLLTEAQRAQEILSQHPVMIYEGNDEAQEAPSPEASSVSWDIHLETVSALVIGHGSEEMDSAAFGLDRREGLETYRRNFIMAVRKQLLDVFPKTREALSADNFDYFCKAYAETPDAVKSALHEIPAGFPRFLANHPYLQEEGWVGELCEEEWADAV